MEKVLQMIDRTEVNAVVIDLRDAGHQYVKSDSALAQEVGAVSRAIRDLPKLVGGLVDKGVYPIARIACFRDNFVPKKHPQRSVVDAKGALWKDRAGYTWLDPYNRKNWDYIAETIDLALDAGFPEIQLDYVRFPSEGSKDSMRFPARKYYPDPNAKPTEVVRDFAEFVRERVHAQGALLSADLFGIISSSPSDQGIGQELETIAEPFDIISPMVYPSHFAKGEYGISDPNQAPYGIVKKSLRDYRKRLPDKEVRPWLQDFSLGGVTYGKQQVRAQIKACYELGYTSFLLWNPKNNYTESALSSTQDLVAKAD